MILRIVERREVEPVGFNLWAIRHIKANRLEDLLDTAPGSNHGVQATHEGAATGQRDIDGLLGQPRMELGLAELISARLQRGFDLSLDLIERGTRSLSGLWIHLAKLLELFGEKARLAKETRLGILERRRIGSSLEGALRLRDELIEIRHARGLSPEGDLHFGHDGCKCGLVHYC